MPIRSCCCGPSRLCLPQALDTLSTWGAKYLSQIVWRKVTRRGRVRVSTGYRVRASHELVLLASFGGRQCHAAFPSIFDGLAREHSRKPRRILQDHRRQDPRSNQMRSVLTGKPDWDLTGGAMRPGSRTDRNGLSHMRPFPNVSRSLTVLFREVGLFNNLSRLPGGRTRTRTLDPLIKSYVIQLCSCFISFPNVSWHYRRASTK